MNQWILNVSDYCTNYWQITEFTYDFAIMSIKCRDYFALGHKTVVLLSVFGVTIIIGNWYA
jgi:hypothetical protein